MANWNDLVIYEMHVGTYGTSASGNPPATFLNCIDKLDHLKELGINCISLMPINEFPGDLSWGYNPSYLYSVESAYGTPDDLKRFVDAAHARGIAVLNDVLYNHIGPNDMDMWQYDGWSLNNGGGIFFYNDSRANTPWGNTRPDYTRGEVRQFIRDNVMMWLTEFRMDGLRWDATKYIRRTDQFGQELPEAWSLLQWCNDEINAQFPGKISVAEDFDDNDWISKSTSVGGAGFDSQWDWYVHNVRDVIQQTWDSGRDMLKLKESITHSYNGNHTERVIYVESHDEVANGKKRMSSSISPNTPGDYWARKRSTLGGATTLFSPGIPFMFQGQEFLEDGWFQDSDPLDWGKKTTYAGIFAMYKDMIALRTNKLGVTRGLTGPNTNVHHVNNSNKLIGWHRWMNGGAGDDVVILANFSATPWTNYRIGMPRPGLWKCRFNSDWTGYSSDFGNTTSLDVEANGYAYDGLGQSGVFTIGPYTVLVYSQGDVQLPGNPADLDASCAVDSGDVAFLLLDMGSEGGPADLDADGIVTGSDLALILLDYGWTCN
jgi:1,4-alpha-glucan branching enzyme